jgi:hypothetical protein
MRILRFRTLTLSKRGSRLCLRRLEEAMNNRGVSPFAVTQMVVSVWGDASFQGARHHDRVVSDLDLGAAIW